ncbi:hypothetical protein DPMN_143088 [Dreissena polymorpha]|uniref:Uncharacterized protein n=1 Tax=Dreissena polymorpha TaxID=45954 RepID=A0A9D4GCG2_DREPO|nr:hypothetical protein DPMN_143088 [Dreissena polymorpha]
MDFWNYIKARKEKNIGTAPLREHEHLITGSKGKAEIVVNQSQSVFTKDDINQPTPQLTKRVNDNILLLHISAACVLKLLDNIKSVK